MDFNLKVSDQRLMASGLAILAIAGVSVSGVLNFPHSANLGLYATFGLLALLIVIWRQGLGLTDDDLQLPFTSASRKNPQRLRWWQGALAIVGIIAYGMLAVLGLKFLHVSVVTNQAVASNAHAGMIINCLRCCHKSASKKW